MRLLLINPKYPESFWSFKWAIDEILPGKRAINPPLGLATIAALTPEYWEVKIIDENVASIPLAPAADIIGICGMGVQFRRQRELLGFYREHGYFVVAGGSYASLRPEIYAPLADCVVAGEAEYLWPRFCADYEQHRPAALYRETGVVALTDSPTPRFDLLQLDKYSTATVQFSRGCPFRCEFCDIIVMFGRRPRHKSIAQVERELDRLRELKVHNVFFVDDNLIGNKAVAKELLRFLSDYQRRHAYPFGFGTEASLNLAQEPELLRLFREAGFVWVFIGLESPDEASLKETGKVQNLREDMLTSVRRIYENGIDVLAGFIIGFDNDTLETFDKQYRFIMQSGIQAAMVGLLTALDRTPLFERLKREGRLIEQADNTDNTKPGTNFIPKNMPYDAMLEAYQALYRRLLTDRNIADRICAKMRYMAPPVYQGEYTLTEQLGIVKRLFAKGLLPGGPSRIYHFLRTLPLRSPRKFPLIVVDWIAGLAMRDYARRYFTPASASGAKRAARLVEAIRNSVAAYVRDGRIALSMGQTRAVPELSLRFDGWLDRRFFRIATRQLQRLLGLTSSTVVLHIARCDAREVVDIERLLARLARYGNRVSIRIDDKICGLVRIDSSVFNLILSGSGARGST